MAFWPLHRVYSRRCCPLFFHTFLQKWRLYQDQHVRDCTVHFADTDSLAAWIEHPHVGVVLFDELSLVFRAHCIGTLVAAADGTGYTFIEQDRHIDTALQKSHLQFEVSRKLNELCRNTIHTHYYAFPVTKCVPTWLKWQDVARKKTTHYRTGPRGGAFEIMQQQS
jgi:hypothetical protein